jgi:hypothetical protein
MGTKAQGRRRIGRPDPLFSGRLAVLGSQGATHADLSSETTPGWAVRTQHSGAVLKHPTEASMRL